MRVSQAWRLTSHHNTTRPTFSWDGTGGRSSLLRDHVDHEDQDCPQPFDEQALTPPYLVSGILLDAMEPSYMGSSIQPGRRYWTVCSCRF